MDVYEKLREILDAHPTGAPKSKAFDEILRILFAPEEAAIALHMNFSLKPVKAISAASGFPIHKAEKMLEAMADRVVVFSREKEGENPTACPAIAMSLIRRSREPAVPATIRETGMKVLAEKGKLDRFMEIMKK